MTGFRQMQDLHAYSGGTVRESHPVSYSPAALLPRSQALKQNIYLRTQFNTWDGTCQYMKSPPPEDKGA